MIYKYSMESQYWANDIRLKNLLSTDLNLLNTIIDKNTQDEKFIYTGTFKEGFFGKWWDITFYGNKLKVSNISSLQKINDLCEKFDKFIINICSTGWIEYIHMYDNYYEITPKDYINDSDNDDRLINESDAKITNKDIKIKYMSL